MGYENKERNKVRWRMDGALANLKSIKQACSSSYVDSNEVYEELDNAIDSLTRAIEELMNEIELEKEN